MDDLKVTCRPDLLFSERNAILDKYFTWLIDNSISPSDAALMVFLTLNHLLDTEKCRKFLEK